MTPTQTALGMTAATLLMLIAGLSKKRLEWKPRGTAPRTRPPDQVGAWARRARAIRRPSARPRKRGSGTP